MKGNQKEVKRKKALGELGELLAIKALVDKGYTNIKNLNDIKRNFPFGDIYAEKNNQRFVISVKTRNKFQKNSSLNPFYKLGNNAYSNAKKAEEHFNAKAYWIAIPLEKKLYSMYFGSLEELNNKNAIPIKKCINLEIGKELFKEKKHYFDWDFFKN